MIDYFLSLYNCEEGRVVFLFLGALSALLLSFGIKVVWRATVKTWREILRPVPKEAPITETKIVVDEYARWKETDGIGYIKNMIEAHPDGDFSLEGVKHGMCNITYPVVQCVGSRPYRHFIFLPNGEVHPKSFGPGASEATTAEAVVEKLISENLTFSYAQAKEERKELERLYTRIQDYSHAEAAKLAMAEATIASLESRVKSLEALFHTVNCLERSLSEVRDKAEEINDVRGRVCANETRINNLKEAWKTSM